MMTPSTTAFSAMGDTTPFITSGVDTEAEINGQMPDIDEDGFVKIDPDHTQLKCLTTDPHAWRLARFRHHVEARHLKSGGADPVVEHIKLGDWITERYPNLDLRSQSNLFDPTVPSPRTPGLTRVTLTPEEIDLSLQIFFGPDHGLESLLLALEPADPRDFRTLAINQHAAMGDIDIKASYVSCDDSTKYGSFKYAYGVPENGRELVSVGADIRYGRLGGHGVGSHIFQRWLMWNWTSPNIHELKFEATKLGRYTWRTLNLPILPRTLDALRRHFIEFLQDYGIPHDEEKIATAQTPYDFAYAVHWPQPTPQFRQEVLKIFRKLSKGHDGSPNPISDPEALTSRHMVYPGVIFLLSTPRDYQVGWDDAYRRAHQNDPLVLTPPDRMGENPRS